MKQHHKDCHHDKIVLSEGMGPPERLRFWGNVTRRFIENNFSNLAAKVQRTPHLAPMATRKMQMGKMCELPDVELICAKPGQPLRGRCGTCGQEIMVCGVCHIGIPRVTGSRSWVQLFCCHTRRCSGIRVSDYAKELVTTAVAECDEAVAMIEQQPVDDDATDSDDELVHAPAPAPAPEPPLAMPAATALVKELPIPPAALARSTGELVRCFTQLRTSV